MVSVIRNTIHQLLSKLALSLKRKCVAIQKKATKQYFPVVRFIILKKEVLIPESESESECDHSNESY